MRKLPRRYQRKQAGFTLLELMLVMAILVVLASLSTFAILNLQKGALQKAAFQEIRTLKDASKMYKLHVGQFPSTLDDLYTQPSGMTKSQWGDRYIEDPVSTDPWHQPYKYSIDNVNGRVVITSAGPDGQQGTDDDVPEAVK